MAFIIVSLFFGLSFGMFVANKNTTMAKIAIILAFIWLLAGVKLLGYF